MDRPTLAPKLVVSERTSALETYDVVPQDKESFSATCADPITVDSNSRRRRRVVGQVALLACLKCRQTRTKCDGEPPLTCSRCEARGYECTYPAHSKSQKDEILRELTQMKNWSEYLATQNQSMATILQSLLQTSHRDAILRRLCRNENYESIAVWLTSILSIDNSSGQEVYCPSTLIETVKSLSMRMTTNTLGRQTAQAHWTSVTSHSKFLDKLVVVFLKNISGRYHFLDDKQFVDGYLTGQGQCCSPALANAIYGMACDLLIPELEHITEQDRPLIKYLQGAFHQEAIKSMEATAEYLTTIQAMIVMYMINVAEGRARSALSYLESAERLTAYMRLRTLATQELDRCWQTVKLLKLEWILMTFSVPASSGDGNLGDITHTSESRAEEFHVHTQIRSSPPSPQVRDLASLKMQLAHLGIAILEMYNGSQGQVVYTMVWELHKQARRLLFSIPAVTEESTLQWQDQNSLMLRIFYHSVIDLLWSPLLFYANQSRQSGLVEDVRVLLLDNAQEGLKNIEVICESGTTLALASDTLYWITRICDSYTRWHHDAAEQKRSLNCCLKILTINTSSFKLCQVMKRLSLLEARDFIDHSVLDELTADFMTEMSVDLQDVLDAMTRQTYVIPFAKMTNWLHADFASQWSTSSEEPSNNSERRSSIRISDICS